MRKIRLLVRKIIAWFICLFLFHREDRHAFREWFLSDKSIRSDFQCMQKTFSQFGEDLMMDTVRQILLNRGVMCDFRYLDVGANHPKFISNTYWLYKLGFAGVCVEPNKALAEAIARERPRDVVLNAGVSADPGGGGYSAPFYLFPDADGLSSFSKEAADSVVAKLSLAGRDIKYEITPVKMISISKILDKYFTDGPCFLCSIDVEGLDLQILKSFDFEKCRPVLFVIETCGLTQSEFLGRKETHCRDFLEKHGYVQYADSYVNTIMIDENILKKLYQ